MRAPVWTGLLASACVLPGHVTERLERATDAIAEAHQWYGPLCAAESLAIAQAHADFTRLELHQGDLERAAEHVALAVEHAERALAQAEPCGKRDTDYDSIVDVIDRCPEEPEDHDGQEDRDGCFDVDPVDSTITAEEWQAEVMGDGTLPPGADPFDPDADWFLSSEDDCPYEAETRNGYLDEDGCPDQAPRYLRIEEGRVVLEGTIQFRPASVLLAGGSNYLLDDVIKFLRDDPDSRLRVEGYADRATHERTLEELSHGRAQVVIDYLVTRGVSPDRLVPVGMGGARALNPHQTEMGHTHNRWVEFIVEAMPPVEPEGELESEGPVQEGPGTE